VHPVAHEQALPSLAAELRESGLTLTGGGVHEQRQSRDGDSAPGHPGAGSGGGGRGGGEVAAIEAPRRGAPRGIVDVYA
jgi:flagellar hook-length control protein FliK